MLPTFVIGLREGLEAALIVGIIAAFLRQRGRSDLLRWVFLGVLAAVVLCTAAGLALEALSRNLPQRQQEGLETVIGLVAVAMVTYMVVWMKRHSRDLRGQLFAAAGSAVAAGTGIALVAMAFLAVLREGLETVVFLLAAFDESGSGASAGIGAVAGILVAIALGYGIYRGGVRLNLSKFFRATGVVLVLVAAGLLVNALHTAHEAGWLEIGQQQTVDLTWLVRPGTVWSSLVTGMLGLQSKPVLIEVLGWLLYLIPVGLYVGWPPGRTPSRTAIRRSALAAAVIAGGTAAVLALVAPAAPADRPVTTAGPATAQVMAISSDRLVLRTAGHDPLAPGVPKVLAARYVGSTTRGGLPTDVYRATRHRTIEGSLSLGRLAERGGGRLPLGALPAGSDLDSASRVPVTWRTLLTTTIWVSTDTSRVVDVAGERRTTLLADFASGALPVGEPTRTRTGLPEPARAAAVAAARQDSSALADRRLLLGLAVTLLVGTVGLAAVWTALTVRGRRERRRTGSATTLAARGFPPVSS